MPILLRENNVISLRSAAVYDNGNLVSFDLAPADLTSLIPAEKKQWAPKDFEWMLEDSVWLYRNLRTPSEERKLKDAPTCIEHDIKPLALEKSPKFTLLWSDSGHSVALYLNGEPWAFIHEETHEGYSKGILAPKEPYLTPPGKLWNEELFKRTFPDAPAKIESAHE